MSKEKEVKPMTPARAFFDKFLFAFYIVALILAICFSSFVWFQKTYFSTYWVNGQSMWPTLNVETRDAQGRLFNENPGLSMNGATGVDFVIGDSHPNVINHIKRFDIIVCKYSEGDSFDKIKRVIAMPGETFYIDSLGKGVTGNGKLHVLNKQTNEYEVIEQPIEEKYVNVGNYPLIYSQPYTLNENEYFVMGDNRSHSSDSRQNGPVIRSNIEAKTVALVARCKTSYNKSGYLEPHDISYMWPRFF